MNRRKPRKGDLYRHFRGKQYRVLHLAVCAETKEEMVVYEEAEGEHRVYVSSLASFTRPVNRERYPDECGYAGRKVCGADAVPADEDEVREQTSPVRLTGRADDNGLCMIR